jgi:hypothetical protein
MLSAASLLLLSLALLVPSAADAAAGGLVVHEGRLDADELGWTRTGSGEFRPVLPEARPLGITGEADLPRRDLLLLVPAHLAVTGVVVEPVATVPVEVPGPLAVADALRTSEGAVLADRRLEPAGGVFPATWGEFGGVHTWRGYRLVAVALHPLRATLGADGRSVGLEMLTEFRVRVVTDGTASQPVLSRERQVPGERARLEAVLDAVVANPGAVRGYAREDGVVLDKSGAPHLPTPMPSLDGSGVRYLIVTTAALAGEFQRLADHRTAMGLPAKVVTREWIEANHRRGIDFQETLRMFLQEAYQKWGLEYLVIGGDTDVIPTRFVRSTFYPFGGYTDIPTDMYYAALDGNWGADGDGWLGEPYVSEGIPGDDADLVAEIGVGRVPGNTVGKIGSYIDKVIAYESAAAGAGWPARIAYAAEVLFPSPWNPGDPITLDGAQYASNLVQGLVGSCTDLDVLRMYETDQLFERDALLTREALIDTLNTGNYGQVNQFGHGHFFNMSVGNANFTTSDADALTNDNSFLLFAVNCASGAFDVSCLMERLVENPSGGAIVTVGAAREAFPSNSFGYQSAFYDFMFCDDIQRTPDALNAARLLYIANTNRNTVDRWTQLNAVVIGDPGLSIWTGSPRAPQLSTPSSLALGEQTVTIGVTAGGVPVAGADVCLRKGDETYAWGVTDALGQVELTVIPRTGGDAELTVSGRDLAVTTTTIPVAAGGSFVAVESITVLDATGNGNGVAEAGEVVSLRLRLRETGGVATGALAVTVTSDDPQLAVLSGSAAVPGIGAGGAVDIQNIVVQAQDAVLDGTVFELRVSAVDGGEASVSVGTLEVLAPEPDVVALDVDDATYGNGDCVWDSGERLVLTPRIKNYGAGRLDQLTGVFTAVSPGVTTYGSGVQFGPLGLLESSEPISGELSLSLDNVGMARPAELIFQDNYGRTVSVALEFNPPAPPTDIETDPTLAADAIVLRWLPASTTRVLGYHVYRAESPDGPWTRANVDLLEGISYFEDRGLNQLTPYWYRITTVDQFLVESDFSDVVDQGTMPAEATNFPLPFQLQTSGHPAVGDVDGDGRLEIVLASDEVYVWKDDGGELIDGDDDAQTTGPLTGVNGQFEPAGVTLAELDGQPGLEIIASERSNAREIHIYRADGTQLPGWPRALQSSWNWATPAVGDVDGDGDREISVNDTAGRTFVWHHDGTELRDGDGNPATDGVFVDRAESWGYSSPALHDLDGDGSQEIIFGTRYENGNQLLAYRSDGTQAPGFPIDTGTGAIICSPAIADLNNDGQKEIVFFTVGHELYVVESDGSPYPGFPVSHTAIYDDSPGPSPAVGNFDADTDLEIVWPINSGMQRMDVIVVDTGIDDSSAGEFLDGWPVQLAASSEGSPVVGDIDGDGVADVIQPVGSDETDTPDLIYGLKADGSAVAGFPIRLDGFCRSTPIICDLEKDGDVDIVYGSWDRLLHVWDMPFAYDPRVVPWPTFQGDAQRTGVARQLSLTGVDDEAQPELPAAFTVLPPSPNPFNPITKIRLYVAPGTDQRLDVSVFDLRGRKVRQLHTGRAESGWHELTWDGRDDRGRGQASGVYFVRAQQAGQASTHKLTLVK